MLSTRQKAAFSALCTFCWRRVGHRWLEAHSRCIMARRPETVEMHIPYYSHWGRTNQKIVSETGLEASKERRTMSQQHVYRVLSRSFALDLLEAISYFCVKGPMSACCPLPMEGPCQVQGPGLLARDASGLDARWPPTAKGPPTK